MVKILLNIKVSCRRYIYIYKKDAEVPLCRNGRVLPQHLVALLSESMWDYTLVEEHLTLCCQIAECTLTTLFLVGLMMAG